MHVNVYSEDLESGIASTDCGKTKSRDGRKFCFIKVTFKTGNAISFFASDEKSIEQLVNKLLSVDINLKLLIAAQKGLLHELPKDN